MDSHKHESVAFTRAGDAFSKAYEVQQITVRGSVRGTRVRVQYCSVTFLGHSKLKRVAMWQPLNSFGAALRISDGLYGTSHKGKDFVAQSQYRFGDRSR